MIAIELYEVPRLRAGTSLMRFQASTVGDAPAFAPHVKGLELPGYDPRSLHTMALGLAVGTRGADHNRSGAYEADFSERTDRRQGGLTRRHSRSRPRTARL